LKEDNFLKLATERWGVVSGGDVAVTAITGGQFHLQQQLEEMGEL
jgi:hypothetical protein